MSLLQALNTCPMFDFTSLSFFQPTRPAADLLLFAPLTATLTTGSMSSILRQATRAPRYSIYLEPERVDILLFGRMHLQKGMELDICTSIDSALEELTRSISNGEWKLSWVRSHFSFPTRFIYFWTPHNSRCKDCQLTGDDTRPH